jgi:hypothetical protein
MAVTVRAAGTSIHPFCSWLRWTSTWCKPSIEQSSWKWWKETGLGEKLPFARDRLVECFFCAACIAPEPSLAGCRETLAKVGSLITPLDDVYDLYGTLDELEEFTDAMGGTWDESSATALPEYMQAMYSAIHSTLEAASDRVMREQGYNVLPIYKKAVSITSEIID